MAPVRDKPIRTKKETLKKRESKAALAGNNSPGPGNGAAAAAAAAATIAGPDIPHATADSARDPREQPLDELSPQRYLLGSPKLADFAEPHGPVFTPRLALPAPDGTSITFHETSEYVYNKRNYRYTHCIADPNFTTSWYRNTEPEPYGPHLSFKDAAPRLLFDTTGHHITTEKGFRTARANVSVREGRWFWECRVTRGIPRRPGGGGGSRDAAAGGGVGGGSDSSSPGAGDASEIKIAPSGARGHVRVGFIRREALLDAPVGFDAYGYGIRDVAGQKVHMSRPKDFFPPGEDICEGDVIGLEIQLPAERLHRKVVGGHYNPAVDRPDEVPELGATAEPAPNIVRDRLPIRFKSHLYYEQHEYHVTKEVEDLMNPSPVPAVFGTSSSAAAAATATAATDPPNPHHPLPALRTLPNSYIKIYRNGVPIGTPFEDLLAFLPPASRPMQQQVGAREGLDDGVIGYYPAVSVFRGGAAEVNFGPHFWYPPPGYEQERGDQVDGMAANGAGQGGAAAADPDAMDGVRAEPVFSPPCPGSFWKIRSVAERYVEHIAEDVMYDLIDEVDFWMQESRGTGDGARRPKKGGARLGELREVFQDD